MAATPDLMSEADRLEYEALTADYVRLRRAQHGIPANRTAMTKVQTKRLRLELERRT